MDPEVGLQTMVEEGAILQAAVVTQLAHKRLIIVFTLLFQRILLFLYLIFFLSLLLLNWCKVGLHNWYGLKNIEQVQIFPEKVLQTSEPNISRKK